MYKQLLMKKYYFVSFQSFTSLTNSHPVPKNDLISGDDFLSILIRGDRNEDLYRDITVPTRVSRYRRPYIKESTSNRESPLPLESLFVPYQDRRKTQYYGEEDDKVDLFESKKLTSTEDVVNVATTTVSSLTSSSTEIESNTEESTVTTEMPSTLSSSIVETTTQAMKVITSVHVSSSVQEEVKIHTKRPKSKHLKSQEDSIKSDSSHFHTIISAPEIVENESEFLYSSIPRSRMQRKQDNTSPYQTVIHHDDQGTISFSSLNIPHKDSQKQRGSWWWYGWNYPHLSRSSTTTTESNDSSEETTSTSVTTTESTTFSSTTTPITPTTTQEELSTIIIPSSHTSTQRAILHDLNKIPYDKLNAPVDDSNQNNDVHSVLGKFVPSCKHQQTTTTDETGLDDDKNENTNDDDNTSRYSNNNDDEQKTDDTGIAEQHSYRSTEEEDDAKFGYVVEGRNYRKYRVEEKTSDGFIVGEYGVLSHNDGSLRGVRYTADSNINPRLIHDALMKFLSL